MNTLQKLSVTTGFSLFIVITSAIYADNMGVSDSNGSPDWDAFGKTIWITLLVTVPAFLIFATSAIGIVVKYAQSRKNKNK